MRLLNVLRNDRGITLVESIVTLIIVGVIMAVSIPSLVGLRNNTKLRSSLEKLQGTLKEVQDQSARLSKICEVRLESNQIKINDPNQDQNCLLTETKFPKGVMMVSSLKDQDNAQISPARMRFSFKGNTDYQGTIVLAMSDGSGDRKCLVISSGLGIMRTGIYTDSSWPLNPSSINGNLYCKNQE